MDEVKDWQREVASGGTRLGYVEWLRHRLEAGGKDPDAGKFVRVEYDPKYHGGDYEGVGQFVLVPMSLVKRFKDRRSFGSVEQAFQAQTGLCAKHIVHYTTDELYGEDGQPIEA